jgi:tetratricopeptide (TPR) repeat protein
LRAIANGATFFHLQESGYRMYAYPESVSRNLQRIRSATANALRKHTYEDVCRMCRAAGYRPGVTAWMLVSMAIFREEFHSALEFLEDTSPTESNSLAIIEPDGPVPLPEGWRRAFTEGTLKLLLGHAQSAALALEKAEAILPTAEGANNLGVAYRRLGKADRARDHFIKALDRFPDYLDAKMNMDDKESCRITTHPLRRQASRSEYPTP